MSYSPFNINNKVKEWSQFLKKIRLFLDARGYTEVSTPALVRAGAFESSIDTLKVTYSSGSGELHSSPEIEMKNLLARFQEPIYQICKVFRDDPKTTIHAIEFTMLEFYRLNSASHVLETELIDLISDLSPVPLPIIKNSVYDLIKQFTGIDLDLFSDNLSLAKEVKNKTSIMLSQDDSWSDIFFKLMLEKIEPNLDFKTVYLLTDFPSIVSPLSKPRPNSTKAERFEIYWKGMEICNGCTELTEDKILRTRYQHESQERKKIGKFPHPEPLDLYNSAKHIKGASGVAVGLDRLFQALHQD